VLLPLLQPSNVKKWFNTQGHNKNCHLLVLVEC